MKNYSSFEIELREVTDGDWEIYVSHVVSANEVYVQYGYEQTEELIECISTMTSGVVYYGVYLKKDNTLVGYVGINPETDNLEFYIFKEYRQREIATLATKALIDSYFAGDVTGRAENTIMAGTLSENTIAIRLLAKLGFQEAGIGCRVDLTTKENEYQVTSLRSYRLINDAAAS